MNKEQIAEALATLEIKVEDGHTLCIRASSPECFFVLGMLTAACIEAGMPFHEVRQVASKDGIELHLTAKWIIAAACQ